MLSLGVVTLNQRQVCLRAGTLGELCQANIVRSLVDRQRSSYALVPAATSFACAGYLPDIPPHSTVRC